MMNNVVNAVIDNLADRFGEATEIVGTISQTVVQETATVGFVNTMIGLGLMLIAGFITVVGSRVIRKIQDKNEREALTCCTAILSFIAGATGFGIGMHNLPIWLAPTREVLREVVKNL